MMFDVAGPFAFPRERNRHWRMRFWRNVEDTWEGLSSARGCYVFTITFGDNPKPWYIGQTCAAGGFQQEIFQTEKMRKYDKIYSERRGTGDFILIPIVSQERWSFSRDKSRSPAVLWLEKILIGMAVSVNPDVENIKDTKFHHEVYVNGLLGTQYPGRRADSANFARRVFGVSQ